MVPLFLAKITCGGLESLSSVAHSSLTALLSINETRLAPKTEPASLIKLWSFLASTWIYTLMPLPQHTTTYKTALTTDWQKTSRGDLHISKDLSLLGKTMCVCIQFSEFYIHHLQISPDKKNVLVLMHSCIWWRIAQDNTIKQKRKRGKSIVWKHCHDTIIGSLGKKILQ